MTTPIIQVTNFRLKLHQYIYNDEFYINILINLFNERFELFNCIYNSDTKSIELKIKKTNIKKNANYSHTTEFYYNIINQIFNNFLTNELVSIKLHEILDKESLNTYNNLSTLKLLPLLYNATAVLDNIIMIYL